MKSKLYILSAFVLLAILGMFSCSDDSENKAPGFSTLEVSADNRTATLTFSESVYANNDGTGTLAASNISVEINGVDFTYDVTHTEGGTSLTINLTIKSAIQGTEIVTVKPANATAIYDLDGKAMDATEIISSEALGQDLGIVGNWISDGDNVAPLLVTYFQVASVTAEFKADNTYYVEQFNIGNETETPDLIFTGTYSMEKSDVGDIWKISLVQEQPYAAESAGMFEIKANPEVLWYEVVQTSGTQNVPPTPESGFGSSNGGAFGDTNIQKFIRVSK